MHSICPLYDQELNSQLNTKPYDVKTEENYSGIMLNTKRM